VKHGILTKDVEVYGTKIKLEGSVTFVQTKLDALEDYFYANSIDTAGIDNIVKECEAIDIDGEPGEPDDSEEAQDSNCPEKNDQISLTNKEVEIQKAATIKPTPKKAKKQPTRKRKIEDGPSNSNNKKKKGFEVPSCIRLSQSTKSW